MWYLLLGWLIYGLYVQTKNVPPGTERQHFIGIMLAWWFALLWLVLVSLWNGIGLVAMLTAKLFDPDHGPLAKGVSTFRMYARHWGARLRGRDPYTALTHKEET